MNACQQLWLVASIMLYKTNTPAQTQIVVEVAWLGLPTKRMVQDAYHMLFCSRRVMLNRRLSFSLWWLISDGFFYRERVW
jgi:hypothetical protein